MYSAMLIPSSTAEGLTVESDLWNEVERSPRFVNIVNGKRASYRTRAAVLWSEEHLFVRYWVQEPFLAGTMYTRDELLFNENNVELFIDGGDVYYELEVSANNTVYEVLFAWRDNFARTLERHPELDPIAANALTFGGNNDRRSESFWWGTHERGVRWAFLDWDLPDLETEVAVHGTVNNHEDEDEGWDVMIKVPWASLGIFADGRSLPPSDGDVWHFQFARYELLEELGQNVGWAWTPVGDVDNHRPEKFTPVRFRHQLLGGAASA